MQNIGSTLAILGILAIFLDFFNRVPKVLAWIYSELNLNQYSVGSPCRTICTVCGSPPCPDLNLIHYKIRRQTRWLAGGLFCLDCGFNFVAVMLSNFQVASRGRPKGYLKPPATSPAA